ncbi:hypothetical protein JHK85_019090 [Glycine max]|nr:hypothetical protein JHK85_019090 [Glycine max]
MDEDEIHTNHHHSEFSSTKPCNGGTSHINSVGPNAIALATSVHELLECLVTTFSKYCENKFFIEPIEFISSDGKSNIYPDLSVYNMEVCLSYITGLIGVSLEAEEVIILLLHISGVILPVSMEEVKQIVFCVSPCKAPSPHGFQPIFYRTYWDIVSNEKNLVTAQISCPIQAARITLIVAKEATDRHGQRLATSSVISGDEHNSNEISIFCDGLHHRWWLKKTSSPIVHGDMDTTHVPSLQVLFKDEGILPAKALCDKLREISVVKLISSSSMLPSKLLNEKSTKAKAM